MRFVPRPGKDLHPHCVTDGDLLPQQVINEGTDRGPRVPKELYPR